MSEQHVDIGIAIHQDLNEIMQLLEDNLASNGGTLSSTVPRETVEAMMDDLPLIVARRGSEIVGFLMTSNLSRNANIPVVKAMLSAYQGRENAYIYGPICVSQSTRGQGLAKKMFNALKDKLKGREGILFIRNDNAPSIKAHQSMGMKSVAEFTYNDADYTVFSFIG